MNLIKMTIYYKNKRSHLSGFIEQTQESNAIFKTKNDLKLCYENSLQKTQSKP